MHIAQLHSTGIITSLFKLYQAKEAATDTVFQVNRSKSSQGRGKQGKASQCVNRQSYLLIGHQEARERTHVNKAIDP